MESALNYYYCKPLQKSTDQETVQKLTSLVKIDIPSDSRRIQLNKEISTPLPTSIGSISRAVEDGVSMGTKEDMSSHPDIDLDSFERDDSISGEWNPEELLSSDRVHVLKYTPTIEEQFESDPVSPNKDRYELHLPHRGLFSDVDEFFGRPTSQNYEFIEDQSYINHILADDFNNELHIYKTYRDILDPKFRSTLYYPSYVFNTLNDITKGDERYKNLIPHILLRVPTIDLINISYGSRYQRDLVDNAIKEASQNFSPIILGKHLEAVSNEKLDEYINELILTNPVNLELLVASIPDFESENARDIISRLCTIAPEILIRYLWKFDKGSEDTATIRSYAKTFLRSYFDNSLGYDHYFQLISIGFTEEELKKSFREKFKNIDLVADIYNKAHTT
jgi:hypothetical protein